MLTKNGPTPFLNREISEREYLSYQIGALLYTPAINANLAEKIEHHFFKKLTSVAICLEDSIQEEGLLQAELLLKETLARLSKLPRENLPLIFVRIRSVEHLWHIHALLGETESSITGYILPKFDLTNAKEYCTMIQKMNRHAKKPIYFMPILESASIAALPNRGAHLLQLKEVLNTVKDYILNVRVGGNDLSNLYGVRRSVHQTIYDIGVVRDILVDIVNIFATDYILSAPVWEYFGESGGKWETGLKQELELDFLNGFIGKTAIHPTQLPIIYDHLAVSETDYHDAIKLLNWSSNTSGVQASADKSRMNEVKCHSNWAKKIVILGQIYGIKRNIQ